MEIDTEKQERIICHYTLEENDSEFLFKTIGYIARSKGMAQIARDIALIVHI